MGSIIDKLNDFIDYTKLPWDRKSKNQTEDHEPSYNQLEKQRLQEQINKMDDGYDSGIKHFKDWD